MVGIGLTRCGGGPHVGTLRSRGIHFYDDYVMDEFEVTHANILLDSIMQGLEAAKGGCVFGRSEPFLVVWISDSDEEIVVESARRLNSTATVREFGL